MSVALRRVRRATARAGLDEGDRGRGFGGGELDLRSAPPGEHARLTAVAGLGGVAIETAR